MLVLGMDVGGTRARSLVADLSGRRLGVGEAGGGNPISHGTVTAMAQIRSALEQSLQRVDPSRISAAVVGIAGFADRTEALAAFRVMWSQLGVRCAPVLTHDTLVGFAAGTSEDTGTVIISGTGAAAVEITAGREGRVADGSGWLLGDEGSGYWVGREAVRHAIRLDALGLAPDQLSAAVADALLGRPGDRIELVTAVYAQAPVSLARLAPVVAAAADLGDPAARRVLAGAGERLEASAVSVRPVGSTSPIVLCGGMFGAQYLTDWLTSRLRARWPRAVVARAGYGAGGAAWLAAQSLHDDRALTLADGLHAELVREV